MSDDEQRGSRLFEQLWGSPSPSKQGQSWRVGTRGPQPWTTGEPTPERVDLGPAGSIRQQLRSARPRFSSWHLVTGIVGLGILTAVAMAAVAAVAGEPWTVAVAVGIGLLLAAVCVVLAPRLRHPLTWLVEQAHREEIAARALAPLERAGWRVFHDRLLPGTEHRVAHLACGPTGVAVLTPLPNGEHVYSVEPPPLHDSADGAHLPDAVLQLGALSEPEVQWQDTRTWEAQAVARSLEDALQDIVWSGPVFRVWIAVGSTHRWDRVRGRGRQGISARYVDGFIVTDPANLPRSLTEFPATLGPEQIRYLGDVMERTFVPAGRM